MDLVESETLDKLYLEWSQFTNARTKRELEMQSLLLKIYFEIQDSSIKEKIKAYFIRNNIDILEEWLKKN